MSIPTIKEMYTLPPLTMPTIFLPQQDVMYKMRNIHAESSSVIQIRSSKDTNKMPGESVSEVESFGKQGKESLPEYHELEARQSKILTQLADLKKQVSTLCHFLKQSNGTTKSNENGVEAATDYVPSTQEQVELTDFEKQVTTLSHFLKQSSQSSKSNGNDGVIIATYHASSTQKPVNIEIVMHADPAHPPYSILALQKLWKDVYIKVTSYKHSSTSRSSIQLSPEKNFNSAIETNVHLSIIWKDIDDLEIVTSVDRCTIVGEVNFLRYLSRLIDTHNYEKTHEQPHVLDKILDWCYKTREHLATKHTYDGIDFDTILYKINQWSDPEREPNIADVALWSLFKQFPLKKKPQILNDWYDLCVKTFMKNL